MDISEGSLKVAFAAGALIAVFALPACRWA